MARGEGEREEAWPEEAEARSDWCRAVRGSKSKAGAGRKEEVGEGGEERGEDGERAAGGDWDDSGSTVMVGQEEEGGAGGRRVRTGPAGEDGGLEPGPDPLKPAWVTKSGSEE